MEFSIDTCIGIGLSFGHCALFLLGDLSGSDPPPTQALISALWHNTGWPVDSQEREVGAPTGQPQPASSRRHTHCSRGCQCPPPPPAFAFGGFPDRGSPAALPHGRRGTSWCCAGRWGGSGRGRGRGRRRCPSRAGTSSTRRGSSRPTSCGPSPPTSSAPRGTAGVQPVWGWAVDGSLTGWDTPAQHFFQPS